MNIDTAFLSMTNKDIEVWTKALIKIIRLHTYRAFIFWWCFLIRSWISWYIFCKWEFLFELLLQCWHRYRAFFGWLVLILFSLSTVRKSISFSSMNFKIGVPNKILLLAVCHFPFSIALPKKYHHWSLLLCFWSFRISEQLQLDFSIGPYIILLKDKMLLFSFVVHFISLT